MKDGPEWDALRVELARGMTEDEEMGEQFAQMQKRINELNREAKRLNPNDSLAGGEKLRQELQKYREPAVPALTPPVNTEPLRQVAEAEDYSELKKAAERYSAYCQEAIRLNELYVENRRGPRAREALGKHLENETEESRLYLRRASPEILLALISELSDTRAALAKAREEGGRVRPLIEAALAYDKVAIFSDLRPIKAMDAFGRAAWNYARELETLAAWEPAEAEDGKDG